MGCYDEGCRGTLWSLWDASARLASYGGHAQYKCDTCGCRFSVKVS